MSSKMFYLYKGVKRTMSAWAIGVAGIFIPIGISLAIATASSDNPYSVLFWIGIVFLAIGVGFMVASLIRTMQEDNSKRQEDRKNHSDIVSLLEKIERKLE